MQCMAACAPLSPACTGPIVVASQVRQARGLGGPHHLQVALRKLLVCLGQHKTGGPASNQAAFAWPELGATSMLWYSSGDEAVAVVACSASSEEALSSGMHEARGALGPDIHGRLHWVWHDVPPSTMVLLCHPSLLLGAPAHQPLLGVWEESLTQDIASGFCTAMATLPQKSEPVGSPKCGKMEPWLHSMQQPAVCSCAATAVAGIAASLVQNAGRVQAAFEDVQSTLSDVGQEASSDVAAALVVHAASTASALTPPWQAPGLMLPCTSVQIGNVGSCQRAGAIFRQLNARAIRQSSTRSVKLAEKWDRSQCVSTELPCDSGTGGGGLPPGTHLALLATWLFGLHTHVSGQHPLQFVLAPSVRLLQRLNRAAMHAPATDSLGLVSLSLWLLLGKAMATLLCTNKRSGKTLEHSVCFWAMLLTCAVAMVRTVLEAPSFWSFAVCRASPSCPFGTVEWSALSAGIAVAALFFVWLQVFVAVHRQMPDPTGQATRQAGGGSPSKPFSLLQSARALGYAFATTKHGLLSLGAILSACAFVPQMPTSVSGSESLQGVLQAVVESALVAALLLGTVCVS